MVNIIWAVLLLIGILVAAVNGNIQIVTTSALNAAQSAVTISIELIGIMSLWLGILKIAEKAGLVDALARLVKPITVFLFPAIPKEHPAIGAIVMNLSANIMGLGNAATPFGLKAMKEMQKLNHEKNEATTSMCTFLALNTACITLIPATIIGIRASAGSNNPAEIVGTTIFATGCSTIIAVIMDRFLRKRYFKKKGSEPK